MAYTETNLIGPADKSNTGSGNALTFGGSGNTNKLDQSTDNSSNTKINGNLGAVSGDGNTVFGAGAALIQTMDGETVDRAFNFGGRALDSADSAYAGGFGFGKEALEIVAGFGSSTIQNANARADSALAAVERLAAVPTERNGSGAQDSRVTLFVLGGLALLALLLGRSRSEKS